MLPFYGEECCIRFFSRKWQFREQGASMLIEQMSGVFSKAKGEGQLDAANTATL
jgi:hypothetical protein